MDLKTIKQAIRQNRITSTTEYERAISLMLANAIMYNLPGSETYEMVKGMLAETDRKIVAHKTTEQYSAHG